MLSNAMHRFHVSKLPWYVPSRQFWDCGRWKSDSLWNFSIVGCQFSVNCLRGYGFFTVYPCIFFRNSLLHYTLRRDISPTVYHQLSQQSNCIKEDQSSLRSGYKVGWAVSSESVRQLDYEPVTQKKKIERRRKKTKKKKKKLHIALSTKLIICII